MLDNRGSGGIAGDPEKVPGTLASQFQAAFPDRRERTGRRERRGKRHESPTHAGRGRLRALARAGRAGTLAERLHPLAGVVRQPGRGLLAAGSVPLGVRPGPGGGAAVAAGARPARRVELSGGGHPAGGSLIRGPGSPVSSPSSQPTVSSTGWTIRVSSPWTGDGSNWTSNTRGP